MKKLILILPLLLTLIACNEQEVTSSGTNTSTSIPSSKTTSAPIISDITLNLTVTGIDKYEDSHQVIWLNCDFLGEKPNEWGSAKLTQSEQNKDNWSITLHDFNFDDALSYNFVYGSDYSPDWTNGKNISDYPYKVLVVEEGKTVYDLNASFYVPNVSGTININFYVNPKCLSTEESLGEDILEGNFVWAWNNIDNNTVLLEKQTDGTWLFSKENVTLFEGIAKVQLTCVLGNGTEPNWNYQQGNWKNHSWTTYTNGISFDFTTEVLEHTENIYFKDQPLVS